MSTTTYGAISPRTAAEAAIKLLERSQPYLVMERFGQYDPQPKKKSDTRKWRRYETLARAVAPLAEGIPPAGQRLTFTDYTAQLEYYGDVVYITDKVEDTHEDPVLDEATKLCSEQMAETVEVIRINVVKGGSTVFYAGTATTRATLNGTISLGDCRSIVRFFKRNKTREISDLVMGTTKIGTQPIAPAFFAVGHTDLASDIKNITGFTPTHQYSDPGVALMGEIGSVEEVRFVLTSLVDPWLAAATSTSVTTWLSNSAAPSAGANPDVYPLMFIGRNAYGIVPLQGSDAVTPTVMNPNTPSKSDPLGQKGFVAWKTAQAAAITNQLAIARLETCATASPS